MEYIKLGRTGLDVSRLCLGGMTYGEPARGAHSWTLREAESRPLIRAAIEAGINFFDTSNSYSDGSSEEILGRALKDFARRDEVVVATKVFFGQRKGPNAGGLGRKAIFQAIDQSLLRLGLDYIDLYQIHRYDYQTPIEETIEALHDVVKAGKARHLGASSMFAYQFAQMLHTAERRGRLGFQVMQNHYNLIYREEEREMLPLCRAEGIAVIPWSPLARGRLARPPDTSSPRTERDEYGKTLYRAVEAADRAVIEAVQTLAANRGVPAAQIALAWLLQRPGVVSPIVGVAKPHHLTDALAALSLHLEEAEQKALEAPYQPHPVVGFV